MSRTTRSSDPRSHGLADAPVPVRIKLSALWVTVMFLFVYVDIFGFYKPGTIDDILVGRVWEFDITQEWALSALAIVTVPALMIFLSLVLPAHIARVANMIVASVFIVVSLGNAVGETWLYYWFGSIVEAVLLGLIVFYAWKWPRVR